MIHPYTGISIYACYVCMKRINNKCRIHSFILLIWWSDGPNGLNELLFLRVRPFMYFNNINNNRWNQNCRWTSTQLCIQYHVFENTLIFGQYFDPSVFLIRISENIPSNQYFEPKINLYFVLICFSISNCYWWRTITTKQVVILPMRFLFRQFTH